MSRFPPRRITVIDPSWERTPDADDRIAIRGVVIEEPDEYRIEAFSADGALTPREQMRAVDHLIDQADGLFKLQSGTLPSELLVAS